MGNDFFADCNTCTACELSRTRTRVVISRGSEQARLMLIGEAPGSQEDSIGKPFVGRSGLKLDKLMKTAGLDIQEDVYFCNVVKCRPPMNRRPSKIEIEACSPWLSKQIEFIDPWVIVLAGATAVQALLGIRGGISRIRGNWFHWQGRWVMPLFHPSYLLRNPSSKEGAPIALTIEDLIKVKNMLKEYSDMSALRPGQS